MSVILSESGYTGLEDEQDFDEHGFWIEADGITNEENNNQENL